MKPYRPHSIALGIPGNTNTIAHPGKPSADRHTHRKLTTLNPRAIAADLWNPDEGVLIRSQKLIDKVVTASTVVPKQASCSKASMIKRFGQKVAALGGIRPGKPQPHNKMVRYMGTVPERSCHDETLIPTGEARSPKKSAQLNELIVCHLKQGDSLLKAEIEKRRIAEIDSALSHNMQLVQNKLSLHARRATNLANNAAKIKHRREIVSKLLSQHTAQAHTAATILADLAEQIKSVQTALADTTRQQDESYETAFRVMSESICPVTNDEKLNDTAMHTGIEHLRRLYPPENNMKFYSPTESAAGNMKLNEAAFSFFAVSNALEKKYREHKQAPAGKRNPIHSKAGRHYTLLVAKSRKEFHYFNTGEPNTQSIKATKELVTKLIKPYGLKFSDVEFIRHEAKHGKAPKQGSNDCGSLVLSIMEYLARQEKLAQQVTKQTATLSQLQRSQNRQRRLVECFTKSAERLERELRQLDEQQKQITQSTKVNTADIWKTEEELQKLQTLPAELTDIIVGTENKHGEARDAENTARESLNTATEELNEHLLNTLPGFDAEAISTKEAETLRAWANGLGERKKVFGLEALSPTDATAIGLQALSMATQGNVHLAAEVLSTLKTISWRELVPQPGATLPSALSAGSTAAITAQLLANVPRGMQVLAHMLRPDDAPLAKAQIEAAQIFLRAGQHCDWTSIEDADTRQLLAAAQTGARYAVHGSSVVEGLAQATDEQRSAFHAFRNGYVSKAANSPYAQANTHLRMFAQWVRAGTTSRPTDGPNPLRSLREGMRAASGEALPTPQRRANEELREAAKHLANYLSARRHAQTDNGLGPSSAELAMRALAEYVQSMSEEKDLTRLKLDSKAVRAIEKRHAELKAYFVNHGEGSENPEAAGHSGFQEVWETLRTGRLTLLKTMDLLQRKMLAYPVYAQSPGSKTATDWEVNERKRFHRAVGTAKRLLYDGDTDKVRSPQALFDFLRDFLQKLEWRDKLRITGQKVVGLNLSPLFAASAVIPSGLGFRLILSGQKNNDHFLEIHMGRTGLYLQIGKQATRSAQIGASIGGGYVVPETDQLPFGLGISANWRMKRESSTENGLQIRVPRRSKGNEIEERQQFLKMFEHLMHLIGDNSAGSLEQRDLLGELLAHHPNIAVGLIADAPRKLHSSESNIMATAGIRAGKVEGDPRRVSLGVSAGIKARSENVSTCTPMAGYMTMMIKDSLVQTRVDGEARGYANVMLKQFSEHQHTSPPSANGEQKRKATARVFANGFNAAYARELYFKGINNFSTLWLFNNEIDPARTDRGFEFLTYDEFAQHVRQNWDLWVNYGIPRLRGQIDEKLEYTVAERMLEDFMQQVREHTRHNKFATILVDWSVKPEVAPRLDALRAQAILLHLAGRNEEAGEMERAFDNLMANPAVFEPTMLLLREKGKRQRERGIDFFGKYQNNRLAESMRTVGQWLPLDPIPKIP